MSGYPADPPPPYPEPQASSGWAYPPPASTYNEPSKGLSGVPQPQPYYGYQVYGYNDPSVPGGGYSQPMYPAQPQPHAGGYTHGTTTVVVAQPRLAVTQTFRECSVRCLCPHCHADVQTATHYETGTLTWVLCFVIFMIGFACCCFIPFCIDSAKDVIHTCPSCRQQIARYDRM